MKLSEKIIKIRKENGLSQEEFGNKIHVSRQAVSKWENEEAKPDTEKIQEIVKTFNLSYEYLLDDEIETMSKRIENSDKIETISKNIENSDKIGTIIENVGNSDKFERKNKMKMFPKVLLIILFIYLLVSIYKFIALYKFYTIANSFSEKNYWMTQNYSMYTSSTGTEDTVVNNITRVGNKILENSHSQLNTIKDENGEYIPYIITYTDIDKKESYNLYYDKEKKKYVYNDRKKDMVNDEEIEELFVDKNYVKENTLSNIPSGFKEIFWASINPMFYYVDIVNREIRCYLIADQADLSVKLTKDYLVESINLKNKFNRVVDISYSYDYVQDHFKEIKNPLETYADKIILKDEI